MRDVLIDGPESEAAIRARLDANTVVGSVAGVAAPTQNAAEDLALDSQVAVIEGGKIRAASVADIVAFAGPGGSITTVAGTIDFGTTPTYAASAVYGDSSVSPTSAILVIPQDGDEFELDGVAYSTVADTDAFTLYARSTGGPIAGIRAFSYVVF